MRMRLKCGEGWGLWQGFCRRWEYMRVGVLDTGFWGKKVMRLFLSDGLGRFVFYVVEIQATIVIIIIIVIVIVIIIL